MSRRTPFAVVLTGFLSVAAGVLVAQAPPPATVPRLQALKLEVVTGDVPAYYSKGMDRDIAASLALRLDACRSLYSEAQRPTVALAILNAADWQQVTPFPYGMPHSGVEVPYVLVVPVTWQDTPWLAGTRDRLAKALGQGEVDRYVRLLAVHELGHVIAFSILGQKDWRTLSSRVPFWYGELVVNYFAGGCYASHPDDDSAPRDRRCP